MEGATYTITYNVNLSIPLPVLPPITSAALAVNPDVPAGGRLEAGGDMIIGEGNLTNQHGEVEIPVIYIAGDFQPSTTKPTTVKYTIEDDVSHKCPQPPGCCSKTPERIPEDKVITTRFNKEVDLLSVIRGLGRTYQEKISINLYNTLNVDPFITRIQLAQLVVSYGLVRLILSYLLYGTFDVKYLTGKYTCQFFRDLKASKYCRFLQAFNTVFEGYDKYYKECI
jgi:hypothetical protein